MPQRQLLYGDAATRVYGESGAVAPEPGDGSQIRLKSVEPSSYLSLDGRLSMDSSKQGALARRGIDWGVAVWAGVIAGIVFMMLEMVMVPLFLGASGWGPPRMIAAIVMGRGVLPPPASFDLGVMMVALIVHLVLSIVFALILAWLIYRVGTGVALLIGAAFGLLLYLVNFYGFTAVFPWFAEARNWVSVFTHVVFGFVAAWAYKGIAKTAD
jgi:uncharacterized membrane protein YagU involved in acid resistance